MRKESHCFTHTCGWCTREITRDTVIMVQGWTNVTDFVAIQFPHSVGLRWTMNFLPGGTKGVAAKLKLPYMKACTDSAGLLHAVRRRFSIMFAYGINL